MEIFIGAVNCKAATVGDCCDALRARRWKLVILKFFIEKLSRVG